MLDIEQWELLRTLVSAWEEGSDYDQSLGVGGNVFLYLDLGEAQFIRHPGVTDGDYPVRARADIQSLLDLGYARIRDHSGRSFTFELAELGIEKSKEDPR